MEMTRKRETEQDDDVDVDADPQDGVGRETQESLTV